MSHTLTPAIIARLAEFAAAITPPAGGPPTTSLTPAAIKAGGLAKMVHSAGKMPAVNHGRRLQTAYVAGGWPRVEEYLQPFLTPAGYARQLAATAAAAVLAARGEAAAPGAAAGIAGQPAGDFGPLPPIDEQQPNAERVCEPLVPVVALATAGVPGYENALASGAPAEHVWLDESGPVHIGLDLSTAAPTSALISTGTGPGGWVLAAGGGTGEAAVQRLLGQLLEAGHPGPLPASECGPCRGECAICLPEQAA
jgi:hypothetical protein